MKKAATERVRRDASRALGTAVLAAGLAFGRCAPAHDPDRLLADLESPDLEVRQDSLEAIDRILQEGDYRVFQRGAESSDKWHRIQSILYLARIDRPEAKGALRDLLRTEKRALLPYNPIRLKPQSEETDSRILVANLIAQRGGDPEAVGALMEGIDGRQSSEILVGTCLALGALSDPQAIPHLATLSRHQDVEVARAAVEGLGRYPTPETLEILRPLATHPALEVRSELLSTLATHDGATTLEILRPIAAADPSPGIRASAVRQFGRFKDLSTVPFIIDRLKDADPATREAALEVLVSLTGQTLGPRPERWSRWWSENGKRLAMKR